jgi:outer membrane protein OmpA-like peptidoglycan-associated protein
MLHLQMGQEVLYLLMTIGIVTSIVLIVYAQVLHRDIAELKHSEVQAEDENEPPDATDSAANNAQRNIGGDVPAKEDGEAQTEAEDEVPGSTDSTSSDAEPDEAGETPDEEDIEATVEPAAGEPAVSPIPNDQPPIITLSEAQGYYFPSGSAELSESFRTLLAMEITPRIIEIGDKYDADVIEVVGHTDEVPVRSRESTIDEMLLPFLRGQLEAEPAVSDNVGLGMARAASVVRQLGKDPRLESFTILPLSAGHTTTIRYTISESASASHQEQERRRIEIRVRRRFNN